MDGSAWSLLPTLIGAVFGAGFLALGAWLARKRLHAADAEALERIEDATREAENRRKELLVEAHERELSFEQEAERRDQEIEERETAVETRSRETENRVAQLRREQKQLSNAQKKLAQQEQKVEQALASATADADAARDRLEQIAQLTRTQAREQLMAQIEKDSRKEATRLSRKIEEVARERAERAAADLIIQAFQRIKIGEILESTVSFIQLPNDEMKGRIIGKEGRNIRALEMATGIDLIVDDTPRSIWISCFDPIRREIARVSIDRLIEDGRIHPARIEEVVEKVREEIEGLVEEKGHEAAFGLGISDLNPKLSRLVGRMRYYTARGSNLLQHALETAMIAGFIADELGGRSAIARRAGLLHEIGSVAESTSGPTTFCSADLCAKYQEPEDVVEAVRSLHPEVKPTTLEAIVLNTANRLSESRPGARKENLAVFIERLKRLESIVNEFPGVSRSYAVKAGKEIRVIVDTARVTDDECHQLSKRVAQEIERQLAFPGPIRVSVVRETRSVRYAV